jgi:tetratricopeptide (TPR) repeat protein
MADLSPELTARIQSLEGSYADNPGRYFVALAGAWREAGEIGRAEEILRENLKRFPGLSAHVLLGRCLADRGAFQEAANEFHYVLSIDAQNLIALRTLAEMAAAGGKRGEAERWYNELLAVDPMNAEARAALQELARGGADAAVADQPVQVGAGWGGASEPLAAAGGAGAGDADEFGMIDLSGGEASSADASGAAADDDGGEWGDLPFDIPSTTGTGPAAASASAPSTSDFDAFGFGSVDLDAGSGADETGGVGAWLDADARQDLGESAAEDRGALAPLGGADALLDAPLAGAGLPFLDADDTVPADLPLLDAEPAGAPGFPSFDAPSLDDGFPDFSSAPADDAQPAFPAFDADADDGEHADHAVDAEVVTETMAELYAAQGLLQQAADTYRELIRQRGEEPGLVRRLAEIEGRLNPSAAEAPAPAAAEEEAPDWLASVDAFAMGGAAAGLAAVHMSAEPEPGSVDAAPETAFDDAAAPEPVHAAAPFPDFDPPAPIVETVDASRDPFADSFAGGFDGSDEPASEPAFAAAPVESGDSGDAGRDAWEAPSVTETEPVGFDLIVVEEDGEEIDAPPEVVADVSADWAIAAAPLDDHEDEADEEVVAPAVSGARASSMRGYFASLLAWSPGQSAASAATEPEPIVDAAPAFDATPAAAPVAAGEPWAEAPAAEPAAADEPWAEAPAAPEAVAADEPWAEAPAAEPSAPEEPWAEQPAAPAADAPASDDGPAAEDEPWAAPAEDDAPQADVPLFDLPADPWAESPRAAAEPPSIDAFELSDDVAAPEPAAAEPEEALPWELPAEPAAAEPEPPPAAAADAFSFEDFFSGGTPVEETAAPEPEPEPEAELRSSFIPSAAFEPIAPAAPVVPPAAPAAPAASAPAGGQDEEDEDLESFQAWLQSLKR